MSKRQRKEAPDPIDTAVGARVRELRLARHLSQTALGMAIGVTFQQVQKYENGVNRIGAGNLLKIAGSLKVPVSGLFVNANVETASVADIPNIPPAVIRAVAGLPRQHEGLVLKICKALKEARPVCEECRLERGK